MFKFLQSAQAVQSDPEPIISASLLEPQCAWCLDEQGIPHGEGSHGICQPHADEQYEIFRQAREERRQRH